MSELKSMGIIKLLVLQAILATPRESFIPSDKLTEGSDIPIELLNQLSENQGRMVIPVGNIINQELQLIIRKSKEEYQVKNIEPVKFVPMLSGKN